LAFSETLATAMFGRYELLKDLRESDLKYTNIIAYSSLR